MTRTLPSPRRTGACRQTVDDLRAVDELAFANTGANGSSRTIVRVELPKLRPFHTSWPAATLGSEAHHQSVRIRDVAEAAG